MLFALVKSPESNVSRKSFKGLTRLLGGQAIGPLLSPLPFSPLECEGRMQGYRDFDLYLDY